MKQIEKAIIKLQISIHSIRQERIVKSLRCIESRDVLKSTRARRFGRGVASPALALENLRISVLHCTGIISRANIITPNENYQSSGAEPYLSDRNTSRTALDLKYFHTPKISPHRLAALVFPSVNNIVFCGDIIKRFRHTSDLRNINSYNIILLVIILKF